MSISITKGGGRGISTEGRKVAKGDEGESQTFNKKSSGC